MSAEVETAGANLVKERTQPCLDWLGRAGELVVGSGCLHSGATTLAVHTDFGPPGQDKETNQDYALAWGSDHRSQVAKPLLAIALADGVTSSYRSEWASELVCAVALRKLVEQLISHEATATTPEFPRAVVEIAFADACGALQEIAKNMEASPKDFCPPGQFLLTWKYILRKGLLLQSTLTLAWIQDDWFRLAMVGDSGLLWREGGASEAEEVLAPDLSTNAVNVLGPRTGQPPPFDSLEQRPWSAQVQCALFSDGVGRGCLKSQKSCAWLLDRLARSQAENHLNPAQECLRQIIAGGDPAYDDNLTLAFLYRQ